MLRCTCLHSILYTLGSLHMSSWLANTALYTSTLLCHGGMNVTVSGTVWHSDTLCCLRAQTIGKTKKSKKPKTPARTIAKPLRITKKKQKNKRSRPLGGLCMALTYYRGNFDFWSYAIHVRRKPTNPAIIYNLVIWGDWRVAHILLRSVFLFVFFLLFSMVLLWFLPRSLVSLIFLFSHVLNSETE